MDDVTVQIPEAQIAEEHHKPHKVILAFVKKPYIFHYIITFFLVITLIPALLKVNLPLRWEWKFFISNYVNLAFRSVFVATILYCIYSPQIILQVMRNQWNNKPKLIITSVYFFVLLTAIGSILGTIIFIGSIALIEFTSKKNETLKDILYLFKTLTPPTVYLFFGLIIVFTYINIIVRIRYYGLYDVFFNNLDISILGTSIPTIAHYAQTVLPKKIFQALDFIYFGMYEQIGATLIICGISMGRQKALQFVGTILFAYYIAIILFFLFPSIGPFYFSGNELEKNLYNLESHTTQKFLLANLQYLWEQKPVFVNPVAYCIGFPCMHIAQPIIVLWYLRKWSRIVIALVIYDILLLVAILILNWHFFTDVLGGIVVAILAILFFESSYKKTAHQPTSK